jgi:O-antigen/teichoic acid export membrane protein
VAEGLADTVIHGASLSGLGWGLAQAITLASYLVLARLATPSEFGEMAAASILVSIGFLFTESGMNSALVQRTDRLEEAANTALISTFLSGIGLSLVGVAAAPLIGLLFEDGHIGLISAVLAPLLFFQTITVVPDSLLQRRFSFVRRTIIAPAAAIAFGAGAIVATAAGLGVWGLVVGQYVAAVVDVALAWTLSRWQPRPRLASFAMWRELVSFGRHVIGAGIVQRTTEQLDRFLLGRFSGTSVLGQYGYAYRLASTPYMAVMVVGGWVLFPAFARIAADRDRFRAAFLRSLFWICALGFPLGLILFPLGEPLAVLLFGDVWRPAGHATMLLCLFPAANAVFTVSLEALKGDGRPEFFLRVYVVLAILTTVLMLSLLPLGLDGIAGALSLASVGSAAYALFVFHGVHPIPWPRLLHQIWPAAAAAALMAGALYPLEHLLVHSDQRAVLLGLALLFLEAVLGAAIYLALLATFARGSFAELSGMARILVNKLTASMRRERDKGARDA